jgi:hypothetical protein
MAERKTRVWIAALAMGCITSVVLTAAMLKTGVGFWFPPCWPGLLLALVFAVFRTGDANLWALALIAAGNALFYAWLFLRILRAEIHARGHLSRLLPPLIATSYKLPATSCYHTPSFRPNHHTNPTVAVFCCRLRPRKVSV